MSIFKDIMSKKWHWDNFVNESKDLIENIFKIKNIMRVKKEYNKKILIACFKISELLNEIKFINDFLKLSS